MSIQQNFPAISPSLSLNFARSKTLDPRITFTRTSTATRVNGQGLIEVVSADTPRFDHSYDPVSGTVKSLGLLIEEQRTNNIQVSAPAPADISKASNQDGWLTRTGLNLEYSTTISPDGTNNAVGVAYTSAYSNFQIPFFYNQQSLLSSNTTYTLSFWVDDTELVESNGYHLTTIIGTNSYFSSTGRYFRVNYNKDTDTFSSPFYTTGSSVTAENANTIFPSANIIANVEKYPNNWKRISITFNVDSSYDGFYDSGNTLADFRFSYGIYMGVSGATNDNVGNSMSTWGWQLEQGSFPTSYIPTSGSTATRTPDNVSITGDNFSDWYNQSEGTVYVSSRFYADGGAGQLIFQIDNGSNANRNGITFRNELSGNQIRPFDVNYSASPAGFDLWTHTDSVINTDYKTAYALKTNDMAAVTNYPEGSQGLSSSTSRILQEKTTLRLGSGISNVNPLNGHISQLTYYPRRLTNIQLQNLTK